MLALLLAACAPAAPAPPSSAPPASAPTTQDASAGDWSRVVDAARREGKVVLIGPQGSEAREALIEGFQRQYPQVEVDYSGMAGAMVAPKLLNELGADQYRTDLIIAGTSTGLDGLQPAGALVPVAPYLVGPNTRDRSVWRDGKLHFADDAGELVLVFSAYVKDGFVYNPDHVSPSGFSSYRDLLHPQWKGRIAIRNPNLAGGGIAVLTFFYAEPSLGKDFIRQFFTQDVVLSNDDRQMLDWVGQGRHPIAIGVGNTITNEYIERGLPLRLFDASALREGSYFTAGNGSLMVVKNAPHPNALKVYLDWLLSPEGQLAWSRSSGFASLRRDVPSDHVAPLLIPRDGVQYRELHREPYVRLREEVQDYVKSILPR
jgi:iron(III) transport system substrate-binding protein